MPTQHWQCPKCTNTLTTHIKLTHPPQCTRHTPKPETMQPKPKK